MISLPTPSDGDKVALKDFTTFRLGGLAEDYRVAHTAKQLIEQVRQADEQGREVLLVAGGSNMVVGDAPISQRVIFVRNTGIDVSNDGVFAVQAGVSWDALCSYAVARGYAGIEALSGIPGSVGATPVQNVGAYGQDVSQTISTVHTYDRVERQPRVFSATECEFAYRDSVFKRTPGRYLITRVDFALVKGAASRVAYAQLAGALGVEVGDEVGIAHVRDTVISLRDSKGMVLRDGDHDTWSAGSFFTNPIIEVAQIPDGAPRYDVAPLAGDQARYAKTSAAWLIEHAGFGKSYGMPGPAALSTKHTLALTNRGDATAADVCELAATITEGVRQRFGITLEPEPNLIGCTIPHAPA